MTQHDMIAPGCGNPSAADLAPPPPRPGSLHGLDCPSRIGHRLHWRGGRVTDIDGKPL